MSEDADLTVTLPDGTGVRVGRGTSVGEILQRWRPEESHKFLAASVDGEPVDLARGIEHSAKVAPLTFEDRAGRDIVQHSSAHLVAKALLQVVPEARPTHGPPTDEGFYYDFDVRPLTPEDLDMVRSKMRRMVEAREPFLRRNLSRVEAEALFASNPHKLRYLSATAPGEMVSVYDTGTDFVDLCRGPHVPDTHWLEGVHLLGHSAVTADGTPTGAPLQRIRGVSFPTRAELEGYLKMRKVAEARDHRILGPRFGLFMFLDEAPGFPVWLPNGMIVVRELERYVSEHLRRAGYSEVRTPLLFPQSVYEESGHWDHYRDNMFLTTMEDRSFGWKPMNCPGSMLVFRSRARSYRELPLRLAEFAPLHRLEPSGTLHGLTRAREFVQDDAHIFLEEKDVLPELRVLLDWIREALTTFQFQWSYELSTRPAGALGEVSEWERAEATLETALRESGVPYRVSPGEGGFYAPKIDIHLRDSLGRPWQTGTIQLDYQMPRRFGLEYQGSDGEMHRPVVIHRTILGSWERFFGVLLEHCAGRLPPWLAPVQVRVLPVTEAQSVAASAYQQELLLAGVRAEASDTAETLPKRIRSAELDRIPYMVVIGEKEIADSTVSVRTRGEKGARARSRPEFLAHVLERLRARHFEP
ncbi:MAG: threonine--tRNA ligase [Thermoplasmata archaeon]